MTVTANAYELAVLLIALAFVVLVIALIPALVQLKKTIKAVGDLTDESRKTVENLNAIIKIAGEQAGNVEGLVKKITEVGFNITSVVNMLVENVKSPLISIISLFFGLEGGLKRFFTREKKGGGDDDKH